MDAVEYTSREIKAAERLKRAGLLKVANRWSARLENVAAWKDEAPHLTRLEYAELEMPAPPYWMLRLIRVFSGRSKNRKARL